MLDFELNEPERGEMPAPNSLSKVPLRRLSHLNPLCSDVSNAVGSISEKIRLGINHNLKELFSETQCIGLI